MKTLFLFANPTNIFYIPKPSILRDFAVRRQAFGNCPKYITRRRVVKMGKNCGGTGDAKEYQQLSADDAKMLQNAEPWVLWSLLEKKGGPSVLELFFLEWYYCWCILYVLSRILTWKSDFGLFGLGFHDDSFVHISQKRASDEFHVSKTNEKNNNFPLTWNFGQFVQICLDSPGSLDLSNSI